MTCEEAIKNWIKLDDWLANQPADEHDPMPISKALWSATKFHIFGIPKKGNKGPCSRCINALNVDVEPKDYHIPNDLREENGNE